MSLARRTFLSQSGLGSVALATLLASEATHAASKPASLAGGLGGPLEGGLSHQPRAKNIIWLFQSGAPSQLDLFDPKPLLNERHGTELPPEVRGGQRLTAMSGNQSSLPLASSPFAFHRGPGGSQWSELVPHMASIAEEVCVVRSMFTEAINHGPGVTFLQTGSQFPGRPSMGAWLDYGLGAMNADLPSFVVMTTKNKGGQPLVSRLWGSGFLASRHQGVRFRPGKDPVLYLSNPDGLSRQARRGELDALAELSALDEASSDPAVAARLEEYELAFRMQAAVPDAADIASEPASTFDLYGEDARTPGTFAANCLLARRLIERGVRMVQCFHPGWDHHSGLAGGIRRQTRETDRASAALVRDLRQRGLLDETLVVWGGEFGRTNYCQGKLTSSNFGRDHHPRCFTIWMAGGGVRGGHVVGATDEFGYNVVEDGVHVHDLHATLLHLLGIDHTRLTYRFQGRQFRLTDVHGHVVYDVLA